MMEQPEGTLSKSKILFQFGKNHVSALESGIVIGQGINVGPGKFVKKN